MAEFPALPLWTDAYLGDTTHLTTIEHGAYLLLLMAAWRTRDCLLPDDDKLLARYTRTTATQWARIRPILERFFAIENGFWRQGRLTDEATAVRQKRESQAANGRASALKRKGRHSTKRANGSNEASTPTTTPTTLAKANANFADSDTQFWDNAKAYLGPSKASLVGQWARDFGQPATAQAITAAQLERAADPVSFIIRCLKGSAQKQPAIPI